ncbi:Uncharacterised protein [Vibrio cholerae]|nr:Uncharacterised protein [Vibrio cholerae]
MTEPIPQTHRKARCLSRWQSQRRRLNQSESTSEQYRQPPLLLLSAVGCQSHQSTSNLVQIRLLQPTT